MITKTESEDPLPINVNVNEIFSDMIAKIGPYFDEYDDIIYNISNKNDDLYYENLTKLKNHLDNYLFAQYKII